MLPQSLRDAAKRLLLPRLGSQTRPAESPLFNYQRKPLAGIQVQACAATAEPAQGVVALTIQVALSIITPLSV